METQTKIIVTGVALAIGAYLLFSAEWFQREFRPKIYWAKQIDELEYLVDFDRGLIRAAARDIKKLQATARLEVEGRMDEARQTGESIEEARQDAISDLKSEIEVNREILERAQASLARYEQELAEAKAHLAELTTQ